MCIDEDWARQKSYCPYFMVCWFKTILFATTLFFQPLYSVNKSITLSSHLIVSIINFLVSD